MSDDAILGVRPLGLPWETDDPFLFCVHHVDAKARFGQGDVQWMTAGKGIVHSEMFPLLEAGEPNPVELFQIWLNLPRDDKLVDPHFAMLWGSDVPEVEQRDDAGRATKLRIVAGRLGDAVAPFT